MKSQHVNKFNHDEWASDYDSDVADESNPIRTGYSRLLDWVIKSGQIEKGTSVLELGSGSGNLTGKIRECGKIVCVDISREMEVLALPKTRHLRGRTFMCCDILEVFEKEIGTFDRIISTYTVHHLTDQEKTELFRRCWEHLNNGGIAVFGDLMFENEKAKIQLINKFSEIGALDISEDIEDEFFWDIESTLKCMGEIGFTTKVRKFSDLSYGILAMKHRS